MDRDFRPLWELLGGSENDEHLEDLGLGALLEVPACRQARNICRQARKLVCFDPAMFLSALWVSFRLILYVLGNLLGLSWAPLGCSWGSGQGRPT